jgi:putative nucleotidyltransferase with HDIG domain
MLDLDALSRAATCLDPLPTSVTRLAALVAGGTPELAEIVEIVQYDQALTGALLKAANSSWSASHSEITSVKDAVVRLGAGPVMSIAFGANVRTRLAPPIAEYGLGEGELWAHSVAASLAAETLMRYAKVSLPLETPTAALLHDVGKLVMCRFLDPDDLRAVHVAVEAGVPRYQTELEVLGVEHAELGGLIAQSWGLPERLVQGISFHHDPQRADALVAYGVHLADVAAKAVGAGGDDNANIGMLEAAMAVVGIGFGEFDEVCRLVAERFEEVAARF